MKKKIWPDNNKRSFNEPLDTSPLTCFILALTLRMTLLFYHIDRANFSANRQILDLTLTLMWYWCVIIELRVDFQGLFQVQMFSVWINAARSLISLVSAAESHLSPKRGDFAVSASSPPSDITRLSWLPLLPVSPVSALPPPALCVPFLTCLVCHLWFRVSRFNWQAHFNNRYKPKKIPCVRLRGCAWLWPERGSEQKKKKKRKGRLQLDACVSQLWQLLLMLPNSRGRQRNRCWMNDKTVLSLRRNYFYSSTPSAASSPLVCSSLCIL